MIGLMVLHWGLVNLNISVSGIDPSSGLIEPTAKSGGLSPATGTGRVRAAKGSGGSKGISGSSGNNV